MLKADKTNVDKCLSIKAYLPGAKQESPNPI